MENIQHVDLIVQQTEALFKSFYGRDSAKTAYVFTADHGMSNVGNHGDGRTSSSVYWPVRAKRVFVQTPIILERRSSPGVPVFEDLSSHNPRNLPWHGNYLLIPKTSLKQT